MSQDVCDLLCLAGPTGAGKTALALRLARDLNGAVVNFDSRQVYADFPIVTAQPTPEEQAQCPHLLYGFLPTNEKITAGLFVEQAAAAIKNVVERGKLPILVGGTGLYLQAFLHGLAPIPDVPAEIQRRIIDEVERQGPTVMHARLAEYDPDSAARIHPNDRQRIARALEVLEATGKPLSWWRHRPGPIAPCRALRIFLDMDIQDLEPRLETRLQTMLDAGALDEVRRAWERCPDRAAPGWSGIGCAELLAHILGECGLGEACKIWLHNTRAYAKRQFTWFRKDPDVWRLPALDPGVGDALCRQALEFFSQQEVPHDESV